MRIGCPIFDKSITDGFAVVVDGDEVVGAGAGIEVSTCGDVVEEGPAAVNVWIDGTVNVVSTVVTG